MEEKTKQAQNRYRKKRYQNDPEYRAKLLLRNRERYRMKKTSNNSDINGNGIIREYKRKALIIEKDKIYNMDCIQGMKYIPSNSIDCIICDPPYGCLKKGNKNTYWDTIIPFDKLWKEYKRIAKKNAAIILFGHGVFTAMTIMSQPKLYRYSLVWKKGEYVTGFLNSHKMPLRNHEDIMVFYKELPTFNPQMRGGYDPHIRSHGRSHSNRCYGNFDRNIYSNDIVTDKFPLSVININKINNGSGILHPTQKPVELIRYLIRMYSNKGDTILDNCMGSGTTAVSCIIENRHFIGFETDRQYYEASCKRINETIGDNSFGKLFEDETFT